MLLLRCRFVPESVFKWRLLAFMKNKFTVQFMNMSLKNVINFSYLHIIGSGRLIVVQFSIAVLLWQGGRSICNAK